MGNKYYVNSMVCKVLSLCICVLVHIIVCKSILGSHFVLVANPPSLVCSSLPSGDYCYERIYYVSRAPVQTPGALFIPSQHKATHSGPLVRLSSRKQHLTSPSPTQNPNSPTHHQPKPVQVCTEVRRLGEVRTLWRVCVCGGEGDERWEGERSLTCTSNTFKSTSRLHS